MLWNNFVNRPLHSNFKIEFEKNIILYFSSNRRRLDIRIRRKQRRFSSDSRDERLGFGITTSLCSSKVAQEFRHNFGRTKLNALVLCSDGVADSFARDKFGDFVRKIQRNIKEHGRETVQKELQEFFPKLSEQGSGDDVSLAGVFEMGEEGGKNE